jgi:oligosaccharide repeat unit polymerase
VRELIHRKSGVFPTGPGILLGISISLHLAALIEGVLGRAVDSSALFLGGQFALSLALLRLYNGRWVLQDIRLFFALFLFLYGAMLPLVVFFGIGGVVNGIAGAGFMYGTAFVGFNLVQWWYKQPFEDISLTAFKRIAPSPLNAMILVGAYLFVVAYAISRGVQVGLRIDRGQTQFLGTQLWVVSIFVINGLTMFMFAGWSRLSRGARLALVAAVIMFIAFQVAMGNRRDFLPMFVFLFAMVSTRRRAVIRAGTVIFGGLAFVAFMAIGIIRQVVGDPALLTRYNPLELVLTQNEFVAPIYTLIHYVNNVRPLRWGLTYISAPAQFVPRAIWPDKPESLSLQFMRDAFGTVNLMGFAYTPVTEAFLNFSWVGPFIVFSIISLLLVKLVRNAERHAGLYLVCYALVVDFHRGEFSLTFYALCFVGGAYWFQLFVSRLRWSPPIAALFPGDGSRARARQSPVLRS